MKRTFVFFLVAACSSGGGAKPDMSLNHACMTADDCTRSPEWSCSKMICTCVSSGSEVCDGRDNDCNGLIDDGLTVATANKAQFVANTILLPKMRTDYAIDLNGDGKADNQLSALVNVLASQKIDANAQIAAAIKAGDQILLFDETSSDPQFLGDKCAGANVYKGAPHPMPNLTGGGTFTVDATVAPGAFRGVLKGDGAFDSEAPAVTVNPVSLKLSVAVFGSKTVDLPLIGAHLSFTRSGTTLNGQIHGAIRGQDMVNAVVPTFAAELQREVTANPTSATTQQQLAFFDNGGEGGDASCPGMACKNPDGSCAVSGDGKIDLCEVSTNSIVRGVIGPDVQMFTNDGVTYRPNPANTHKDSVSVGIAFTAVDAKF
jgi:hypothetical protein